MRLHRRLTLIAAMVLFIEVLSFADTQIIIGQNPGEFERHAAKELQRYIYQLTDELLPIKDDQQAIDRPSFVIGQRTTNAKIDAFVSAGHFAIASDDPGPQGYLLKKITYNAQEVVAIAGSDDIGCLYGAYGLVDDYYGVGFFMGGDVLPESKSTLTLVNVDEKKQPIVAIRGFLPWTNFPQSATVYSWEDWKFIIDQMAKMRMNMLHIHNYNGQNGHLEMYHNWEYNGAMSRVWMPTAKSGHNWSCPGWDVNKYEFGASDLFDDYDFGADCALYNEDLDSRAVFGKGVSQFKKVIEYAHSRGVKIALGIDIDLVPPDYGVEATDPGLVQSRVDQIINDYPNLDYLICFRGELSDGAGWDAIFSLMYDSLKNQAPQIKTCVAGWGLAASFIESLPADVIAAPISHYSSGWTQGSTYGTREFWACPWLEKDFDSSGHYYPYNMHLSDTISSWQNRASNLKGLYCLSWRITDGVDAKMSYVAKVPWDTTNQLNTSQAAYHEYSVQNYGSAAADDITAIINQNEPIALYDGECRPTPALAGHLESYQVGQSEKAQQQLGTIDTWISTVSDKGSRRRLELLRCRIEAVKDFLDIYVNFPSINSTEQLPGSFASWAKNFSNRVTDISSLGNIQSIQNRYVQLRYIGKETQLIASQSVKAPSSVMARGTAVGASITWQNRQTNPKGFNVYRNGVLVNTALISVDAMSYTDTINGTFSYSVSSVDQADQESPRSASSECMAGSADAELPLVVVISPPTSCVQGRKFEIKARVLDNRTHDSISAQLYYRAIGQSVWETTIMQRRTKAVFIGTISGNEVTDAGLEYYVQATDGANIGYFPVTAPIQPGTCVTYAISDTVAPSPPANLIKSSGLLQWTASGGDVHMYRIYRSEQADFEPGMANFVTYVEKDTRNFNWAAYDFNGSLFTEDHYYKITAIDAAGNESDPTASVRVDSSYLFAHWKLDEMVGNTAYDTASYRNGTLFNSPIWRGQSGKYGGALEFDGLDDYVVAGNAGSHSTYTVSVWVKPYNAGQANIMVLTGNSGPLVAWSHQLRINANGKFEHYLFDGSQQTIVSDTLVQPNTWYHLVAVAESGGLMRLYVNGAEEGTALSIDTPWTNGTQWMMGRETAGGYSYYEGLLDDVRVYQTPKSPGDTLPLCSEDMASDFDNNCIVDMHDLLIVLQSWLSEWGAERVESIEKAYE